MSQITEVHIPDIGGATNVDVIEVFVKSGDTINQEDSILTLEGDKATMEVPSPVAGTVKEVKVKVGDKVSEGDLILMVEASDGSGAEDKTSDEPQQKTAEKTSGQETENKKEKTTKSEQVSAPQSAQSPAPKTAEGIHASPIVRRLAAEFEIDLAKVTGTGPKGRITKQDIKSYIQGGSGASSSGLLAGLPPAPQIDFSKFGPVETQALSKIQKFSGPNLHRNWLQIPHITQTHEADITELEAFRQQQKEYALQQGIRLTPLVFIMKAVVSALKQFPKFNSSLAADGQQLIIKNYYHIGVAVDTPNGLVVPVIRDTDKKSMFELAKELADVSAKAREKGLTIAEMSGGCFTISSLGGIGGGFFTPIVNAPEVAILGVSRSQTKPIYDKETNQFIPRLMLPLSLSYDHRVIDGAEGARFVTYLGERLADIRTLLL